MVKLKKYNKFFKLFVIFITLVSCGKSNYQITKIEGKQIPVTDQISQTPEIENFIRPYRTRIDADLNSVLAYNPQTLDKNGSKWQSPLGNLLADITLKAGEKMFQLREKKSVDLCLLNQGGIRAILPKGNVSMRTAFEIMPFENSLVVVALKGAQIQELIAYFIAAQKAHPIAGLGFVIDKENKPKNILIQEKPFDLSKTYYVATNDYLANGGDSMIFFKKSVQQYVLDYKMRNILIDYFKEVDSIPLLNDSRIIEE